MRPVLRALDAVIFPFDFTTLQSLKIDAKPREHDNTGPSSTVQTLMSTFKKNYLFPALAATCLVISGCSDSDDSNSDNVIPESVDSSDVTSANDNPVGVPVADAEDTSTDGTSGSDTTPVSIEDNPPVADDETTETADSTVDDSATTDTTTADSTTTDSTTTGTSTEVDTGNTDVDIADLSGGVDLSGGDDDSPTTTESLSLVGPSTRDASRGAGPPSTPSGLTQILATENWVEFSWVPSVDDQAVKAYEIYRDGELIATVSDDSTYEYDIISWLTTSFTDCNYTRYANCVDDNLQPLDGASYTYSVVAVDNEGLKSAPSEEVLMTLATPSQSTVDLDEYEIVFQEEFDETTLDLSRWKTALPWGPDTIINREQQYFVNILGGDNNEVTYDPFVFNGETLQITGIETPANQRAAANNQPFLSGVLTTADYFEMTYGYVEMSAKAASGDAVLSTFYLFNQSFNDNKPEIDILEHLGARPDKSYQTYHYFDSNRARSSSGEKHSSPTMETDTGINLDEGFHTYGVLWEPELVVWYIDGVEVRRMIGPRVSDEPMNIVTHLVIGSEWIGEPDADSIPAVLEIDYVRAYQK